MESIKQQNIDAAAQLRHSAASRQENKLLIGVERLSVELELHSHTGHGPVVQWSSGPDEQAGGGEVGWKKMKKRVRMKKSNQETSA